MHPKSWSSLTACPTAGAGGLLEAGSWAYDFKASRNGTTATVQLSGHGDPGYNFTYVRVARTDARAHRCAHRSAGLAEAALCLSGKTTGCMQASAGACMHARMHACMHIQRHAGVTTSMATMDAEVMKRRLEAIGLVTVKMS